MDIIVNLELLRQKRREKRVRQLDISKALGKSPAYYTLIEKGVIKNISVETAAIIKRELNLAPEESEQIFGI